MRCSLMTSVISPEEAERTWDIGGYLDDCALAEELGFYGVYKGERRGHGPASGRHGAVNSATLLGSHVLAHTTRLVFGTNIVILPLYHPTVLIQDATMVNALHGGRFRLGVGAGYSHDDLAIAGIDRNDRIRYMRAGLEAFDAYRTGAHYEFAADAPWAGIVPPIDPAMGPLRPDVLVGAWTPAGARLAALGDAWASGPISRVEQLASLAATYRRECEAAGKTPHVIVMRDGCVAETRAEATALASNVLDYHRIYFARGNAYDKRWEPRLREISTADELTLDMLLDDRVLCGTPDDWVRQITAWQEVLGADEMIIRLGFFVGPEREAVHRQMRLVASDVMPAMAAL